MSAHKGKNTAGEDVYADADGGREIRKDGQVLGWLSSPIGFDPLQTVNHRYQTVSEIDGQIAVSSSL